jgi:hypothetical protein
MRFSGRTNTEIGLHSMREMFRDARSMLVMHDLDIQRPFAKAAKPSSLMAAKIISLTSNDSIFTSVFVRGRSEDANASRGRWRQKAVFSKIRDNCESCEFQLPVCCQSVASLPGDFRLSLVMFQKIRRAEVAVSIDFGF